MRNYIPSSKSNTFVGVLHTAPCRSSDLTTLFHLLFVAVFGTFTNIQGVERLVTAIHDTMVTSCG